MAAQKDLDGTYMKAAIGHSLLSKAVRKQVGAVLVTRTGVMIPGFNGTARGRNNCCEDLTCEGLITKQEVIHAELNCILKAAREGISCEGSTVYVTLLPCIQCAAMLINAGVTRVVYLEEYRIRDGLDILRESGIVTEQFQE